MASWRHPPRPPRAPLESLESLESQRAPLSDTWRVAGRHLAGHGQMQVVDALVRTASAAERGEVLAVALSGGGGGIPACSRDELALAAAQLIEEMEKLEQARAPLAALRRAAEHRARAPPSG